MSPNTPTPHIPEERHPFGLEPKQTATNQRARPVPYFAGTRRLGVTWLGPAYNQRAEEVHDDTGGGGGKLSGGSEDRVVGHDYFADCAALICLGAVDSLLEVWMDGERAWCGNVRRSSDSASITIEDRGNMRIYWGTATQPVDSILALGNHPAYRGQCYVVFEQLAFGRDKTQAPNVELVLSRGPQMAVGGIRWIGQDVNAVHVAAEWLTNKRWGLGLNAALLDTHQLARQATRTAGELLGISPLITEQLTIRDALLRLCEYIDAWPSFSSDNKFSLPLNRSPNDNARVYPLVGEYDLTEPAKWGSEPWVETLTQVSLTFTDRCVRYEPDEEPWTSAAAEAVVGEPIKETIDRPWVCTRPVAQKIARRYGRLRSVPLLSGQLSVRRNLVDDELRRRGDEIEAGSLVRFTTAAFTDTLLLRVVRKRIPDDRAQVVELDVETDRYYAAVLDYTPDDVPVPDELDRGPRPLLAARVVEVNRLVVRDDGGAEDIKSPHFVFLAVRRSVGEMRVKVIASEDAGSNYRHILTTRSFCGYGSLHADFAKGIRVNLSASVLVDVPAEVVDRNWPSTSERGLWAGEILAFIGNEILSVREVEIAAPTQVRLNGIIRARFGYFFEDHAAGDEVFIVKRSALASAWRHWIEADDAIDWKMMSGTRWAFQSPADVTAQSMTVVNYTTRPLGPANLRINGDTAPPFSYAAGGSLVVKWSQRHWLRHQLWQSFDEPYKPTKLEHRIYFYTIGGTEMYWTKVKDALRVEDYDGEFKYTLPNTGSSPTSIQHIFGGTQPDVFLIRIFSKARGLLSVDFLEAAVIKVGSTGDYDAAFGALCWAPSGMFRIWGLTNPSNKSTTGGPDSLIQQNFDLIAARYPTLVLPWPNVTDSHARQARTRVKANFTAIATFRSITLHDVLGAGARNPALVTDANFEKINATW